MDLGIRGKTGLVCAGSKGLGRGCAEALAEAGVDLVINARGAEALNATAAEIAAKYGVRVTPVAADITTEAGRAEVLAALGGQADILVNNAGGPPPGKWTDWSRDDFIKAFDGRSQPLSNCFHFGRDKERARAKVNPWAFSTKNLFR